MFFYWLTEPLVKKFGLTPEQFAENVRDNYQRHEVEQQPVPPLESAAEYVRLINSVSSICKTSNSGYMTHKI